MTEEKRYYWLKLKRDFFKRHDIQIIESVPNGKDYVLFYLKLLAESIDHEGLLRFNDLIPYSEQMLSTITNTNIDIVRSAITLLKQLDLIEILDDQTIFVKDTAKMMGEGSSTERVRRFRDRKSQKLLPESVTESVTETLHETEIEKEIDIEIEREIDTEAKSPRAQATSKSVFGSQKNVYLTQEEFEKLKGEYKDIAVEAIEFLSAYIAEKGYKSKSHYLAIRRWVIEAVKERRQRGDKKSVGKPKQNFEGVQYSDEFMKSLEADPEELLARLNKKTEEIK